MGTLEQDEGSEELGQKVSDPSASLGLVPPGGRSIRAQDAESLRKGLARLVLQIINLIRRLMERQAARRMASLPPEKQEELGSHLMLLEEKMEELREYFGIDGDELDMQVLEGLDQLSTDFLRSIAQAGKDG